MVKNGIRIAHGVIPEEIRSSGYSGDIPFLEIKEALL
jgi:hypothetical protein